MSPFAVYLILLFILVLLISGLPVDEEEGD